MPSFDLDLRMYKPKYMLTPMMHLVVKTRGSVQNHA